MQQEELKAYQVLKKQGAFFLKSPKYSLVVASTNLPNLTVTLPFQILVMTTEYINRQNYIPKSY